MENPNVDSDAGTADAKPTPTPNIVVDLPDNFRTALYDFCIDLSITFPEYSHLWVKWTSPDVTVEELTHVFGYCVSVYPERFFDILYQNGEIFNPDNNLETRFLPGVDFKLLFHCDGVTENTKKTMWKYLQLILFSVIGNVRNKASFGDTMNMFDGINEKELNEKLNETMSSLTDFFKNISENVDNTREDSSASSTASANTGEGEGESGGDGEPFQNPFQRSGTDFKKMFENMPNIGNIQDHLKTLFDGKIGSLAKELAAEITEDLTGVFTQEDMENITSTEDVLKKLMKNPKKIMDMMKMVGTKLDRKMNSGDISKDEIMKEASELMSKMKEMGGTEQFNEIFKNLTKGMGLGKNVRMDTNALSRMTKQNATRERLLKKMEANKMKQMEEMQRKMAANSFTLDATNAPNSFVYRVPGQEDQPKSMKPSAAADDYIHPDILAELENTPEKKPKSGGNGGGGGKKKKGKK